ncbi:ABC transporter ATP-binding protein [Paracoccus fistulariae]|uniref:ABC transporter ATP-binding protein n=1 Tax=Paracoccus fistulariae TaxID=658446 RepID=A0ABY7SNI7_9RHOB|nr:ABC transporter ATP-binding protein [Paracoccus fistulariae]MDB6179958.1 ABC transporter ATP-binding protein [Paracoccus fistulariae]WCR08052.1 ABC transporter ATP-binding protein [Paracoccus fistulariae]
MEHTDFEMFAGQKVAGKAVPMLRVSHVARQFGGRQAVQDVSLSVCPGQVTCLLGSSGCGKSTTLRMIAGIEQLDAGSIHIDGQLVADRNGSLRPEKRSVGMVFQDLALFPHMTVFDNIAFGMARDQRRTADVEQMLDRVGLRGYGAKYPHQLSGGEQQRIALARALATGPKVMLLDEPFSSLDQRLRSEMREFALDLLREAGAAVVLVTHDPDEAMMMADRIAIMDQGRVLQQGAPLDLYHRPANLAVAQFFSDLNLLPGKVSHGGVATGIGAISAGPLAEGTAVTCAIRPEHLRPARSTDGAACAKVSRIQKLGRENLIELSLPETSQKLRCNIAGSCDFKLGDRVTLDYDPATVMVFPA